MEFADFNGDGKDDYLVANYTNGSVHGFINFGGTPGHWNWDDFGQIASGESTPTDPPAIKFGDFNAAKKDDYLVLHSDGRVEEWQNMGGKKGSWHSELKGKASPGTGQTLSENFFPEVSSDINADGRADYLNVRRMTEGSVQAWLNNGGEGRR